MTGRRISGQIRSLQNLNDKFNLGYTDKEISELSSGQLRRRIGEAKAKHNIHISSHSRYRENNK